MKLFSTLTFCFILNINNTIAQNFAALNFINYESRLTVDNGSTLVATYVKLWYNNEVTYFQEWEPAWEILRDDGKHYTHEDSLKNQDLLASFAKSYNEDKRLTMCFYANNDSTKLVDYVIKKGEPYYVNKYHLKTS
jgi:hypothetical protein